ncbi:uncharacterized protein [Palaemon carinicauda]|uniref:uncharacterized protein isoform X2 n=1 Tax=Palaemon carinicauda TaxID=392227 RepID=UPI0035B6748E
MISKFNKGSCILIFLHLLGIEASPEEYIFEGCLLERFTEEGKAFDTKEDKLNLIIGPVDSKTPALKVKAGDGSINIPLPDNTSIGLTPIQVEFSEKKVLVSSDGNWRREEMASLRGLNKSIYAEDIYVTKNCTQDLPYRKITVDKSKSSFPLSLDRDQTFQIFLTKPDIVQVEVGDRELHLCWNEGEIEVFDQGETGEKCNLPIMVPLRLHFYLNSTSRTVQVTNTNISSFPYGEKRVSFSAKYLEGEVFVVQCLRQCPEDICAGLPLDVSSDVLVTFVVLLSIANLITVTVIIYQCKKQREEPGDKVATDEANARDQEDT